MKKDVSVWKCWLIRTGELKMQNVWAQTEDAGWNSPTRPRTQATLLPCDLHLSTTQQRRWAGFIDPEFLNERQRVEEFLRDQGFLSSRGCVSKSCTQFLQTGVRCKWRQFFSKRQSFCSSKGRAPLRAVKGAIKMNKPLRRVDLKHGASVGSARQRGLWEFAGRSCQVGGEQRKTPRLRRSAESLHHHKLFCPFNQSGFNKLDCKSPLIGMIKQLRRIYMNVATKKMNFHFSQSAQFSGRTRL